MKAEVITAVDELHTKYIKYLTNHTKAILEICVFPPRVEVALVRYSKHQQRRAKRLATFTQNAHVYIELILDAADSCRLPKSIISQLTGSEFWLFCQHVKDVRKAIQELKYRIHEI